MKTENDTYLYAIGMTELHSISNGNHDVVNFSNKNVDGSILFNNYDNSIM